MAVYPSATSSVGTGEWSTLAQLDADLKSAAGDTDEYWVSAERQDALNEAIKVWQAMSGAWVVSFGVGVVSGEFAYDVPKQVTSVQRVLYNGSPLTAISIQELDLGFPGWEGTSGTPQFWAPLGLEFIVVYPVPTSGTLTLQGLQEVVEFTNASDIAKFGIEEETRILGYGLHYLSFKEGPPESQTTKGDYEAFVKAAAFRNARFRSSAAYLKFMGLDRAMKQLPVEEKGVGPGVRK